MMLKVVLAAISLLCITSCTKESDSGAVSQRFIHKYGFAVSEKEWQERNKEGKVISSLPNGVTETKSYSNGVLHGETTYTFQNSEIIEKRCLYDQGTLIKETLYDTAGTPYTENAYEFDNRVITTSWFENGAPCSIEEFDKDLLMSGQYFSIQHQKESSIENGSGIKTKRDRKGALIAKEEFSQGLLIKRTNFHANGTAQSISHYKNSELHGNQTTYSEIGTLLTEVTWNEGNMDGTKYVYLNEKKQKEIPYTNGQKNGLEVHYDQAGNVVAQLQWDNGQQHGSTKYYYPEHTEIKWFYRGEYVTLERFKMLELRDKLVAELKADTTKKDLSVQ